MEIGSVVEEEGIKVAAGATPVTLGVDTLGFAAIDSSEKLFH